MTPWPGFYLLLTCLFVDGISAQFPCEQPLGLQDGRIQDGQLLVSSEKPGYTKEQARLEAKSGDYGTAWCPAANDSNSWFEVDFKKLTAVGGLRFQHPSYGNPERKPEAWLTAFTLYLKSPLVSNEWLMYSSNFTGLGAERTSLKILHPAIVTSAIRILPRHWVASPCFRFEVLGCAPEDLCLKNFCQNGGSCVGENFCSCPDGFAGEKCQDLNSSVSHYDFNFEEIVHGVLVTAAANFSTYGNVSLDKNASTLLIEPGQYIKDTGDNCLASLDKCRTGFTYSLSVMFQDVPVNGVILSTRADSHSDEQGLFLVFENGKVICSVRSQYGLWEVDFKHELHENTWTTYRVRWNPSYGLQLLANRNLAASIVIPTTTEKLGAEIPGNLFLGSLSNNFTFQVKDFSQEWRREDLCSSGFCQNKGICIGINTCRCAEDYYGRSCQYKASTQPPNSTVYPGVERHDVVCTTSSMEILVPETWLPYRHVTLRNPSCVLTSNGTHHAITVPLSDCSTSIEVMADNILFVNELIATDSATGGQVRVHVACRYPRLENITISYLPVASQTAFYEIGDGRIDVVLGLFTDASFTTPLATTGGALQVKGSDKVYVQLAVLTLVHPDLAVQARSCVASPSTSPVDASRVELIRDGCAVSALVTVLPSNLTTYRFTLRGGAFSFQVVYIHCQAALCVRGPSCQPQCGTAVPVGRRRRAAEDSPAHLLSAGPLFVADETGGAGTVSALTVVTSSLAAVFLVAVVAMAVALRRASLRAASRQQPLLASSS